MAHGMTGELKGYENQKQIVFRDSDFPLKIFDSFKTKNTLFANDALFPHMPTANDIEQGALGDCYLLASLMGLLDINPHSVLELMKDLGDGWVIVRLYYNRMPEYYKIQKTYLASSEAFGTNIQRHRAMWVYVIEKAYVAYRISRHKEKIKAEKNFNENKKLNMEFKKLNYRTIIYGDYYTSYDIFSENRNEKNELSFGISTALNELADVLGYTTADIERNDCERKLIEYRIGRVFHGVTNEALDLAACVPPGKTLSKALKAAFKDQKFIKSDDVIAFVEKKLDKLQGSTWVALVAYIKREFSNKRGTGQYTATESRIFSVIVDNILERHAMSASTRASVKGTSSKTCKGLAPSHMYEVTGVFTEADTNLKFVKVRNPWMHTVRDYQVKLKGEAEVKVLSAFQAKQLLPDHHLWGVAGGFRDGEFAVELSDFVKRFDQLLTAITRVNIPIA